MEGEPKSIAGRKWANNVLKLSLIGVVAAIIGGSKGNSIADRKPGDIRQGDKLGQRILTKPTLGDTAALIGVVAAIIAGVTYALGTLAHLSYFDALGFDGHQFPALSSELQLLGGLLGAIPALLFGAFVLTYVCLSVLINPSTAWLNRHPLPKKLRIPIGLAIIVAVLAHNIVFGSGSPKHWVFAAIFFFSAMLAGALLAEWVPIIMMACLIVGVGVFPQLMQAVVNQSYELGQTRANKAGKSHATRMIEFTDHRKIPAPGDLITCSERFCGFHDGKTATVISLEGVLSIQLPMPPDQQPAAQPDAAERAPATADAPEPDK